jgi:TRAP-type C4-dicarboxylate transport system permease small subunit
MSSAGNHQPTHGSSRLVRLLTGLDAVVGVACKTTLQVTGVTLLLAIGVGVVARYLIQVGGIDWAEELPKQIFTWFIMAGIVLAAQSGQHISVELLYRVIPEPLRRPLLTAVNLLVAVAYVRLAMAGFDVADITSAERNPMLGTPGSLPFYALAIGSVLTSVASFSIAARVWILGFDARPIANPEESVT